MSEELTKNITICKSNLNCYANILQGPRWEGAIEISTDTKCGSDNLFSTTTKKIGVQLSKIT